MLLLLLQTMYAPGTELEITAVPDPGYDFVAWEGDLSGSANPATITVDGDYTINATFSQQLFAVDVTAGPGGNVSVVEVQPPPPGGQPALYFESGWESGDRNDGGLWPNEDADSALATRVRAVQSEGSVAPVEGNWMLRVMLNGTAYHYVSHPNFIRAGDSDTYLRFYIMHFAPSAPLCCFHGIQDFNGGSSNFYFRIPSANASGFLAGASSYVNQGDHYGNGHSFAAPGGEWDSSSTQTLSYGRWYRVEIHIAWLAPKSSATPATYEMRIYDDAGVLIIDNANITTEQWDGTFHGTSRTLADLFSEGRALYLDGNSRSLFIGSNGPQTSASANPWFLIDAVAASAEGWIGPVQ